MFRSWAFEPQGARRETSPIKEVASGSTRRDASTHRRSPRPCSSLDLDEPTASPTPDRSLHPLRRTVTGNASPSGRSGPHLERHRGNRPTGDDRQQSGPDREAPGFRRRQDLPPSTQGRSLRPQLPSMSSRVGRSDGVAGTCSRRRPVPGRHPSNLHRPMPHLPLLVELLSIPRDHLPLDPAAGRRDPAAGSAVVTRSRGWKWW